MRSLIGRRSVAALAAAFLLSLVIGTSPVRAGTPPVPAGTGSFNVDANNNVVYGGGWSPSSSVTIEVWDSTFDTKLVTPDAVAPTDEFGSFQHGYFGSFDIVAGQKFVVTDGTNTTVMTDTDLVMTGVSFVENRVEGSGAIPDTTLQLSWGGEWNTLPPPPGSSPVGVVADGNGDWSYDFDAIGVDLQPARMQYAIHQFDGNGNIFNAEAIAGGRPLWPHLVAGLPDFVSAVGYDGGATVHLQVTWPGGGDPYEADQVVPTSPNEWEQVAYFGGFPRDLVPGTVLTLTGPTPEGILDPDFGNRELVLTDMAVTGVDLASSTVSGFAGPSRNIEAFPGEPGYQGDWVRRHTKTDSSGSFDPQSFSVIGDEPEIESATLQMTTEGQVWIDAYDEPDFDVQRAGRDNVLPPPVFTVGHSVIDGWGAFGFNWQVGATMTVTVDHPDTPESPDFTDLSAVVDAKGEFHLIPLAFDVHRGDLVTVSDGSSTKDHVVTFVAVTAVNKVMDTISGTAMPFSPVHVFAATGFPNNGPPFPESADRYVTADASGHWTAYFGPGGPPQGQGTHDIRSGSAGYASQGDADGDSTWDLWTIPLTLFADPSTGLSDAQPVQVSGSGIAPNASMGIVECVPVTGPPPNCVILGFVPTDGQGDFASSVTVTRVVNGVDVSATGANLVAFDPGDPYGHNVSRPITFLPPLGELTLTIGGSGMVGKVNGFATISGTLKATTPGWTTLTVSVSERIGRTALAQGAATIDVFVPVAGVATAWTAEVRPAGTVPFGKGNAEARASVEQTRFGDSSAASATKIVSLGSLAQKPPKGGH